MYGASAAHDRSTFRSSAGAGLINGSTCYYFTPRRKALSRPQSTLPSCWMCGYSVRTSGWSIDAALQGVLASLTSMTLCGQCCRSLSRPPSVPPIDVINGGRDTFACRSRSLCFVSFLREYKLMVEVSCEEIADPDMLHPVEHGMEAHLLPTVLDALSTISAVVERRFLLDEVRFLGYSGSTKDLLNVSSSSSDGDAEPGSYLPIADTTRLETSTPNPAPAPTAPLPDLKSALAHTRKVFSLHLQNITSGAAALHERKAHLVFEACQATLRECARVHTHNVRMSRQLEASQELLDEQRAALEAERKVLLRPRHR